ncbi:Fic family protein [Stenotrophomonas maltophilia]|uniref:Fic family protein n=1 Tax=Stenotrophomonas maltophilia TaxID=40324 RepID=UPI000B43E2A9|nr:Fic family protein [Stenotrophomonas maltophilia]
MLVRNGLPADAISLLAGAYFRPAQVDEDKGARLWGGVAHLVHCRMRFCEGCNSELDRYLQCRRGLDFKKACRKRDATRLNPVFLKNLHRAASPAAPRCGQFRLARIRVGSVQGALSFIATHADLEPQIKALMKVYAAGSTLLRAYFALFIMSILHPFEDGNGRVMRAWLLSLDPEGGGFPSFLAVQVKLRQDALIVAMSMLADLNVGPLLRFHEESVESFEKFSRMDFGNAFRVLEEGVDRSCAVR